MGIPLLAGREINDRDDAAAPAVVVISESVAQRMFADRNPLGQRVDVFGAQSEVVGVVKDAHYQDLRQPAEPMAYRPYLQTGDADLVYGIRTTGDPEALTSLVRRELREVAHDVPVFSLNTLEARVDASLVRERMVSNLSTLFGCFALLIASIGLYGRLSYSVAERTGEIGVRMALGARQGSVIWMVLRDALLLTASGIAIGLPLALASTRAIRSLLFGMAAADLSTYTMIVVAILGVTILAGYIPARRAANIDPMTALRHQ
jgi:predicted permease